MSHATTPETEARMGFGERLLTDGLIYPGYRWAPRLMHWMRPTLVRMIWRMAPDIREALLSNASVLLESGSDERERREFGLQVLTEIQKFTEDLIRTAAGDPPLREEDVNSIGNIQQYFDRRSRGDGVVIATAHMGSFEAAASILVKMEKKVHVVYARDPVRRMERMRSRMRRRIGVVEHAVDDGIGTWRALQDALENDEAVALPADRVQPGQHGFPCPVLGNLTRLPAGPFKLAMTAGSPLVPAFCWRDTDGRYRIKIDPPIEFKDSFTRDLPSHPGVQRFVQAFESILKEHPAQWLMVFEAWPKTPREHVA